MKQINVFKEKHLWVVVLLGIFLLDSYFSKHATRSDNIAAPVNSEVVEVASDSGILLDDEYLVSKVVDGDTLKVSRNGKIETVRLIGVDTPEIVDPRKPIQCFAKEASEKMKQLVYNKKVRLEIDKTQGLTDKYKRLLRYVLLEDGTNINKLMVSEGFAHEYTHKIPYKFREEFKTAELNARNNNLGLWSPDTCNGKN